VVWYSADYYSRPRYSPTRPRYGGQARSTVGIQRARGRTAHRNSYGDELGRHWHLCQEAYSFLGEI